MVGQPKRPADYGDNYAALAEDFIETWKKLRPEVHRLAVLRPIKIVLEFILVLIGIAVAVLLFIGQASNSNTSDRISAIVTCQNSWGKDVAQILQDRVNASKRSQEALNKLIFATPHLRSSEQFRRDVDAYERAEQALSKLPVPPLPPPACH